MPSSTWPTGLNVFTGETGAGKTMLAQAIGLLAGAAPVAGMVGPHASEAYVEAEFAVPEGFFDGDLPAAVRALGPTARRRWWWRGASRVGPEPRDAVGPKLRPQRSRGDRRAAARGLLPARGAAARSTLDAARPARRSRRKRRASAGMRRRMVGASRGARGARAGTVRSGRGRTPARRTGGAGGTDRIGGGRRRRAAGAGAGTGAAPPPG